jgi:hypothetical protein
MDSLTSGWRHYRMLADYAAASPWLAQVFARSHIVEFPFDIGSDRERRLTKYSLQNRGCRVALRKYCRKYPNNDSGNLRWILQTVGRLTQTL